MTKKIHKHNLRFAVLATDCSVFAIRNGVLHVLLVKVSIPDFAGKWGLPGGLIHPDEVADESVRRHLKDKVGLYGTYLEQLYTFSKINRDPRGRVVSVAYIGLARSVKMRSFDGADNTCWLPIDAVPKLAYDHNEILAVAIERLRARIEYTNIIQFLLPKKFTFSELQLSYETVLGRTLDKRNFRKKITELKLVERTGQQRRGDAHRPADLYRSSCPSVRIVEVL